MNFIKVQKTLKPESKSSYDLVVDNLEVSTNKLQYGQNEYFL